MQATPIFTGLMLSILAVCGSRSAHADELVQVAPHRATVAAVGGAGASPLLGFLARPQGSGRFPAVVLLHGSSGFSGHDTAAASMVKSWGYVGLALDSLGGANIAGRGIEGTGAEIADAFAGLRYLANQDFVAGARIAVMGYSMGGIAALLTVDKGAQREAAKFRAMVGYYPPCEFSGGVLTAPALILIGEHDDWTPASRCEKLAEHQSDIGISRSVATGTAIELVIFPGATHAFDYQVPQHRYLGHLIQYDEAAARDAEARVHAFLLRELGDHVESP